MTPMRQGQRRTIRGWRAVAAVATVMSVGGLFATTTASAQVEAKGSKPTKVVKQETRTGFGLILTTKMNKTLYVDTTPPCTGGCLTVWPPLLMPAGKTMPSGATGLGTVAFGSGRLQVTYHGMPLYTFTSDHGKQVNGNGVAGFEVAKVSAPDS
jgi:predicted lipoprotein with Yx(FWY)xxD motif